MYYKSILLACFMVLFGVLAYLFLYSGFCTKTKIYVNYKNNSDVYYDVKYFDLSYDTQNTNDKYIADMVEYIDISFNYNNILSEYVSGYYEYSVDGYLISYENDIEDVLWEKEYKLVNRQVGLLDKSNINSINIADSFKVDFQKFRSEIINYLEFYDMNLSGYFHIRINILEFLSFSNLDNEYADNKVITVNIPLTNDIFKINSNNIDVFDSYYEFSRNRPMNIVFIIIGAFCFSVCFALLVLIVRQFIIIYGDESDYNKKLREILIKYDSSIVRVNKLYVNKRYNLIYLDSFNDLIDICNNKNKIINFKEVKRGAKAMFLVMDDDNAWIYRLISNNLK